MGQDFGEARHKGTHHQEVYEFFVKILIINLIFICDSLKLSCGYLYIYKNVCLTPVTPPQRQVRKSNSYSAPRVHLNEVVRFIKSCLLFNGPLMLNGCSTL